MLLLPNGLLGDINVDLDNNCSDSGDFPILDFSLPLLSNKLKDLSNSRIGVFFGVTIIFVGVSNNKLLSLLCCSLVRIGVGDS